MVGLLEYVFSYHRKRLLIAVRKAEGKQPTPGSNYQEKHRNDWGEGELCFTANSPFYQILSLRQKGASGVGYY